VGWISRVPINEPKHYCGLPGFMQAIVDKAAAGSVWECPICKTRYLYKGTIMGQIQWEKGYPK